MNLRNLVVFGAAALALPVYAQFPAVNPQWEQFRGQIKGSTSDGSKCRVEVVVDGTVEIEIQGTQGRMRTLDGQRGTWRRIICNTAMPPNPLEFKLKGVEGRGRLTLLNEPLQNRGAALIRIEDSKGGADGYTFDLEWNGAGGRLNPGNPGNQPANGNDGGVFSGVFGGGSNPTPVNTGSSNNVTVPRNWKDQVNFQGNGDGYLHTFRNSDDLLISSEVTVDRAGAVRVIFRTRQRDRMTFTGRLMNFDGDRLVADMAGEGLRGSMEIKLDSRNRVEELAMTGVGRNRFELRWQGN